MASFLSRLLKHRLLDERDAERALGAEGNARVAARVVASEARHTGQIRVCIEAGLPLGYLQRHASARERAVAMFGKLRVWDTEHNNGVLVYVLLAEHAIEIVADRGIDRRVDAAAWDTIAAQMKEPFRGGDFAAGLDRAIDAVDALLVRHFPRPTGEGHEAYPNELPDAPDLR
ncbi:MAG: TPM domain-containing protein [Caldimonas sp.]